MPDKQDPSHVEDDKKAHWLAKLITSVTSGSVKVHVSDRPALRIDVENDDDKNKKIDIDILEPELFEENTNLSDKLKNASDLAKMVTNKDNTTISFSKKFAQELTDNDVTLSISRKCKEAIKIGKEAKPTLSKLLSGSDNIQIKSTKEAARLTDDVATNAAFIIDRSADSNTSHKSDNIVTTLLLSLLTLFFSLFIIFRYRSSSHRSKHLGHSSTHKLPSLLVCS